VLLVEMTVAQLQISLIIVVKPECPSDSSQNSQPLTAVPDTHYS